MRKLRSRGAALVDYGLIIGLVSIAAIGAVNSTGKKTESIYCMASNGLARVTDSEIDPSCVFGAIELAEGERFVSAPRRMEAAFTDVTFPNDKSGEHVVLSQVATKPESRYTLKTSIASLDAYDPDRTISSCYLINNDVEPICSEPGETSTLWVPADAEAIGYAITLSEDKDMPWSSDVNIAVPQNNASITIADGSWDVRVSRENPAPIVENVSFAFATPYSYEREDTGWTYGEFAAIEGKFNQSLTFELTNLEGDTRYRRACYKGTASSQPVCSTSTASNSVARITVPAGVAQIGYEVELPAKTIGADWSVKEVFALREGTLEKHRQEVTITRPNEPTQAGSLAAAFMSPYSFKQTDTGWTNGEFVALSSNRNVTLSFSVDKSGSTTTDRKACYKLKTGDEAICGVENSYYASTIDVPIEAVEVGYQLKLPAEAVGNDWKAAVSLSLSGGARSLFSGIIDIVRPNEPYAPGAVATSFGTPYTFKQTDTGWTDGEFVALSANRNVALSMSVDKVNGSATTRKACYKLEAGGASICGTEDDYYAAKITVPVEAVEVGYQLNLPAESVGPDWTAEIFLNLSGGGVSLTSGKVTLVRPNEPWASGGVASSFTTPYTFAKTDTGVTDGEFIALTGSRNVSLSMTMYARGGSNMNRAPCYKLVAGGEATCAKLEYSKDVSITVPIGAVEIGYRMDFPGETAGPTYSTSQLFSVSGGGKNILYQQIAIERPNEPYRTGSLVTEFSTPYTYPQTATGYTDGEFVKLSGEHNSQLTFNMTYVTGSGPNRQACYKLVEGGTATCGSASSSGTVTVAVPVGAVEVGYRVSLPTSATTNYYTDQRIRISSAGGSLIDKTVRIAREN